MKAELVTAYDRLMENCRAAGYAGYDPFDGLESRIFKVTPMRHFRPTRLLWQQAVKRSPINLRRIYDKGIDVTTREGVYNTLVQYRTGDMISPKLDQQEALAVGTRHFLDCIRDGRGL